MKGASKPESGKEIPAFAGMTKRGAGMTTIRAGITTSNYIIENMKEGYVYILTNRKRTVLYTGVTSDLVNRVLQHKRGDGSEFTKKYEAKNLVYYESHQTMYQAITREKQIKKWKREWKLNLIRSKNPEMKDLWNEILSGGRFHF